VSHKLHEVLALSDNVTVLRDGRVTLSCATADTDRAALAAAMTGRDVELDKVYPVGTPGEVLLSARGLTMRGHPGLHDVSLEVRAGEVVGIAGVAGNGQTELVAAIAGLRPLDAGTVTVAGHDAGGLSVRERRAAGLAHIPEDRAEVGSAPGATLSENLAVGFQRRLARRGLLRPGVVRAHGKAIVDGYGVRAASDTVPMRTLSGGNQQKAILGRELTHDAPVLLVEQPTRGVDIGAVVQIHERLIAYRDAGHALLLVSAELSEIRALADRVLVMYEGRVVATFTKEEATYEALGLAMAGGAR
jgi:simple sugar transport system ATP-binding protein